MKKVIVGHRGVGKTNLLKRHSTYFPDIPHFDLDLEIEKKTGQLVAAIFLNHGELYFRKLENQTFKDLVLQHSKFVISLGAGFDLIQLDQHINILFVSRITDKMGRIFIDRPRLDESKDPLDEYAQRFSIRQLLYQTKANAIYHMSEGIEAVNKIEKEVLTNEFKIEDAIYTLSEKEISQLNILKKNFDCIELRSDLIPMKHIFQIVGLDQSYNWLVSVRTNEVPPSGVRLDFDLGVKNIPATFFEKKQNIISCHEDNIDKALDLVRDYKEIHLKVSPLVENFEDLLKGHKWQQQAPQSRSFLPRSENGKWLWFRQLSKYWQNLNFIRNHTDLKDQPSVYQWLCLPRERPTFFAAVVGNPVLFSRSPETHQNFFNQKKSFFTAIEISEPDYTTYFPQLIQLGLTYVAVTSPLKKLAFQMATKPSDSASIFKSANTLICKDGQIFGENTDFPGFQKAVQDTQIEGKGVAVWGGGGTLQMMKMVLPKAQFFSARSEDLVTGAAAPEVLIWAAPRTPDTKYPPQQWQPKLVVDLNYLENSMGLQYAQKIKCSYVSGLGFFKAQALYQQKYWSTR